MKPSKSKPIACEHCERRFNGHRSLRQHHRDMHPQKPMPTPPPPMYDDESEADRHVDWIIFGRRR